jgi:hypothetical protein
MAQLCLPPPIPTPIQSFHQPNLILKLGIRTVLNKGNALIWSQDDSHQMQRAPHQESLPNPHLQGCQGDQRQRQTPEIRKSRTAELELADLNFQKVGRARVHDLTCKLQLAELELTRASAGIVKVSNLLKKQS